MDTMPHLSSSPPPLCNDDEGAASEEEEFGDFGKCPAGADGFDISSVECASKFTKVSPTLNLDTRQCLTCINQPIEQSQPTSTVNLKPIDDEAKSEDVRNGLSEKYPSSDGDKTSVLNACSFTNGQTDFADFSVFGEQAAHAWCCGLGGAEFWDGNEGVTSQKGLSEPFITSSQEVILDSEPKSSAYKSKEDICTKVNHCERKNKLSQDFQGKQHYQVEGCHFEEKKLGKAGESHKERKHSFNLNFLRASKEAEETLREEKGKKEKSVSTLSQTASLYDFADNASCDEDSSQEELSEDFEPNVSSLASQEDTDTEDQTDDEVELRNYRLSRSFCNDYIWYGVQASNSDVDTGLFYQDQSAAQEFSATSVHPEYEPHSEDSLFRCVSFEPHMGHEQVQLAEGEVQSLGSLPPSDSFADFCSAPSQEDGEWMLFQDQRDKQEGFRQYSDLVSSQGVLHCHVQQLFQDSFPQLVSAEEVEDPVYGLDSLLFLKDQSDHEEEEARNLGSQWVTPGLWWPSQDIHSGVGLQYQWAGSHTNRSLLRCLGVDTRNIVFIGIKKQPVVVPAFASHRGMLEFIKVSLSAVRFPGHTTVITHAHMRTWDIQSYQGLLQDVSGKLLKKWPTTFKEKIISQCRKLPSTTETEDLIY